MYENIAGAQHYHQPDNRRRRPEQSKQSQLIRAKMRLVRGVVVQEQHRETNEQAGPAEGEAVASSNWKLSAPLGPRMR
jgi:hypothetical protein